MYVDKSNSRGGEDEHGPPDILHLTDLSIHISQRQVRLHSRELMLTANRISPAGDTGAHAGASIRILRSGRARAGVYVQRARSAGQLARPRHAPAS